MFRARCDTLAREVLIWPSDVAGLNNTGHGIIVRYRCPCGGMAEMLTGARSPVRVSVHIGDAA